MGKINKIEKKLEKIFSYFDDIALKNQSKVLKAFKEQKISTRHFAGSTGYGYDDIGRDTLNKVFANVFGAETAIVSPQITCGSHAIAIVLFGLLRPGDTMLSIAGKPYDTLDETIFGVEGENRGSLKDLNVNYKQIDLIKDKLNFSEIKNQVASLQPKVVFLQRSRGYNWRSAISIDEIEKCVQIVKKHSLFKGITYNKLVKINAQCTNTAIPPQHLKNIYKSIYNNWYTYLTQINLDNFDNKQKSPSKRRALKYFLSDN